MCRTARLGDIAETAFLCRAVEEGLRVAWTFGGGPRYDAIVDNGRKRLLVQVKFTAQRIRPGVYVVRAGRQRYVGHGRAPRTVGYLPGEIDFLAVYVAPEKMWYILRMRRCGGGRR